MFTASICRALIEEKHVRPLAFGITVRDQREAAADLAEA